MISQPAGRCVSLFSALVLLGTTASGQEILHEFHGAAPGDFLGWANSGAGDVNDDGYDDIAIGAPFADPNGSSSGLARVYSGKDGTLLHEWLGENAGDRFGQTISDAGDVDRDGHADIVVGILFYDGVAGNDTGAVRVYSGQDGSLIYHWDGDAAGDAFGDVVADAGDVNDDGWPDIVASSRLNDTNGASCGMARVFSGADGTTLYTWFGADAGDAFGGGLDAAGDVNDDGYDDVIIGARWDDPNGIDSGSATVFSGVDGSVLHFFPGGDPDDGLGNCVGRGGDLNKDGYDDVLVGIWRDDVTGTDTGSMIAYSGLDGSELFSFHGDNNGDRLGVWVSRAGDVDHDGWEDMLAGIFQNDHAASNAGALRIYSGKDGSMLFTVYGDGVGDELGVVAARAFDVNADGWSDVIAGAYWNDQTGLNSGMARVYSGAITVLPSVGTGLAGTNGVPELIAGGTLEAASPLTFKLNEARPNAVAHFIVGFAALNAPFKGGTMVPAPSLIISGLPTDDHGQFLLDATFPPGAPGGVSLYFQYWVTDPAGPQGFAASNGVVGVTP
jgi:hypothetical protein